MLITGDANVDREYLSHYGVLGMKWGVRRGRASSAYGKASKKLTRISKKVEKLERKAAKSTAKADKQIYGRFGSEEKAVKYQKKAARQSYKAAKQMEKAVKWCDQMDKAFSNTGIGRSKSQIALGEEYIRKLNMRALVRSSGY